MTPEELRDVFAFIREHSSPVVWGLLDSVERMVELDRAMIENVEARIAMLDGMLSTRLAVVERNGD